MQSLACVSEGSIVQAPDRGEGSWLDSSPWEETLTANSVSHQSNVAVETQMPLVMQSECP